ncbi:carbohydrate-binding protein [Butyrivibrio sp. WCD2001]|uniref:carbohydrate-binding protein n=1 Tax=Butyrivibrio sp. WCD2001 TaxID=1280681 RepID=UPI00041EF5FA|nr:carbohydrate-binding protein [Butyrivibrio sp. WCD2001]
MRKKFFKIFLTVALTLGLCITGAIPIGKMVGTLVVNAANITLKARDYDGDYSVTNGVGLTYDSDKTAKLGTIANGDKAKFKNVSFGNVDPIKAISFKYSKPNSDSVRVTMYLDKEGENKIGEWSLSHRTSSFSDPYKEKFFSGIEKASVGSGKHDIYLKFTCGGTAEDEVNIYSISFFSTTEDEDTEEDLNTATWEDQYKNDTNKNKPYYRANIYTRSSYVILSDALDAYSNKTIFGDPYAIKGYKSLVKQVPGISYNYADNTLTLNNFDSENKYLDIRNMGKAFKIKLVGKNNLKAIYVSGANWPTPLHFTGSGSVVLNASKSYFVGPGLNTAVLYLDGWHKESFIIDKKAKVTAYGYKKNSPVVLSYGEGRPALKKAVKISFSKKGSKLDGKFVDGKGDRIRSRYKYNKKTFKKK